LNYKLQSIQIEDDVELGRIEIGIDVDLTAVKLVGHCLLEESQRENKLLPSTQD